MLDLRLIRNHPDVIRRALARRNEDFPLDELLSADEEWRSHLARVEQLKAKRNEASEAIGRLKREGKDAEEAIVEMRAVAQEISALRGAGQRAGDENTRPSDGHPQYSA